MAHSSKILEALAWFGALGYPPTREELWMWVRGPRDDAGLDALIHDGGVHARNGRVVLKEDAALIDMLPARERAFPRKWKKSLRLARWLRLVPSVRFVALANTTALGFARDEADIDLFLITRRGTLWLTRLLLVSLARLFGRRPGERSGERDAWCFSFLMDDSDLHLERFALTPSDPYLAHWTIRLLPVLDDGVGEALWHANAWAWQSRAVQTPWIAWNRLASREGRVPRWVGWLDRFIMRWQRRGGSKALRRAAAAGTTEVVMNQHVCKTHLEDRRAWYREQYERRLEGLDLAKRS